MGSKRRKTPAVAAPDAGPGNFRRRLLVGLAVALLALAGVAGYFGARTPPVTPTATAAVPAPAEEAKPAAAPAAQATEAPALAQLTIASEPSGAQVVSDGQIIGLTPLILPEIIPGRQTAVLRLRGYRAATVTGVAAPGADLHLEATLEKVAGPEAGRAWTVGELNLEMKFIAPGTFRLGTPEEDGAYRDEAPATQVTLTRGFWLGRTEVTQREWSAVMGENHSHFKGDDLPVELVNWDEAVAFCRALTARELVVGRLPEGYAYTLPTEAQWEYACRAGTTGDYAGELDDLGWYRENSNNATNPVGRKEPNAWGLADLHGNVWEWCADWAGSYPGGQVADPTGAATGKFRIVRGGGWGSLSPKCRSAFRDWYEPGTRNPQLGFRLALVESDGR